MREKMIRYRGNILLLIGITLMVLFVPEMLYYFIAGLVLGAGLLAAVTLRYCDIRRKYLYRWECHYEGCGFRMSTDADSALILEIAAEHERQHEMEN